ncbi:MAG: MltA domain-containing protein, partial [Cyanobacteriota bacterium]
MRALLLLLALLVFFPQRGEAQALKPAPAPTLEAQLDPQLWRTPGQRQALLKALNHSLGYLKTPQAAKAYRNYPIPGVTQERTRRSLLRFQTLLAQAKTPQALEASVKREFIFYQAQGQDNQGTVHFTGYFEPVYQASRRRTGEYQYPVYRLPKNFSRWPKPHPTREQLEGQDGRGGQLKGSELLWFSSRLAAYLVQIQGSAKINLLDGTRLS